MRTFLRLLGLGLLIFGVYFLGQKIVFTTGGYGYWWRGIAANSSILALVGGALMLVFLPRRNRNLGWIPIAAGIVLIFFSGRAILNPTSLWQFLASFLSIAIGYRMLITGQSPI
ncbi:hypothetical protein LEP3755_51600 [Leptolyngbya sp. NIES-3755]|nr:hypothetical protein LEP3755_51600 [Leptolyngbya sp. NIES-3755]